MTEQQALVVALQRKGLSTRQIAKQTGIPLGTVNNWLARHGEKYVAPSVPKERAVPPPYARGFRWFHTRWS